MYQMFNVCDKRMIKKLENSKRFMKYPEMFLSNTCKVRVNSDDFLLKDEFIIQSKYRILPRRINLYGKKSISNSNSEDNLYLNYWMPVFLKTVERGNLIKYDFPKSDSKQELCIGLSFKYRAFAFNYRTWMKSDVIKFLKCLFNDELFEAEFEQQDILDCLPIAS